MTKCGNQASFLGYIMNSHKQTVHHIMSKSTHPAVDHPQHYQGHSLEAIDVIEDFDLNYNLGNVIKYVLRARHKGDYVTDLSKARWYIERELSRAASLPAGMPIDYDC